MSDKPILEAEEVAALMQAVAPEEATEALLSTFPPLPQPEKVDDFEFAEGTAEGGPEQYPMFGTMHERIVEIATERWSSIFNNEIPVFFKELKQQSYLEVLDSDIPRVYFTFECTGLGTMLAVYDLNLVVSYIDAMLGGNGELSIDESLMTLSPIEMRLSQRIAESTITMLERLWHPVRELKFQLRRTDIDPMAMALTAEDVPCFSVAHIIVLGEEMRGEFSLHYPLPFLEPMLGAMRSQVREQRVSHDEQWVKDLNAALDMAPLRLRLEMGRCRMHVGDFLNIQPGDILPFAVAEDEAATLWVESLPAFRAQAGRHQGMLAAEILEPITIGGNA